LTSLIIGLFIQCEYTFIKNFNKSEFLSWFIPKSCFSDTW